MMDRRLFLASTAAFVTFYSTASAEGGVLTAQQAHDAMSGGSLILVDIRTPQEWQSTGVASGAWPMDMTHDNFGPQLMSLLKSNPGRDVAVICRTGRRSAYLVDVLKKNNINDVLDVSEGMAGGSNGQGWIKTGLPTVSANDAVSAIPADFKAD